MASKSTRPKINLRHKSQPSKRNPRFIIDLFAGVGGLSLGAARAGFKVAAAVELDKNAIAAHAQNFPKSRHLRRNISKLTGLGLLKAAGLEPGELFGLVGGPPCQGFSWMGKQRKHDSRNQLFGKFFQLVAEAKPKFFVVENVPGILDENYKQIRNNALDKVNGSYVIVGPMLIKASDYGAATTRERVFYIGYLRRCFKPMTESTFVAQRVKKLTTVGVALAGLPSNVRCDWQKETQGWRPITPLNGSNFERKIKAAIPPEVGDSTAIGRYATLNLVSGCLGTRHSKETKLRFLNTTPGRTETISRFPRLKLDALCPTLRAGTGSDRGSHQAARPIHPIRPRVITPREAARLQGFPDWFQFAPSKWHSFRQIGNSVSPFVSEAILRAIYRSIR